MSRQDVRNSTFNIMCRLCLASDDKLLSIFDENYTFLPQRIAACVNVEIYRDDSLPKTICEHCLKKVENWFDFKKCCDDSQSKLRQWASINSIICNKSVCATEVKQEENTFFVDSEVEIVENDLIIIKEEAVDPIATDDCFPQPEQEEIPSSLSELQVSTHESTDSLLVPTFECPASVHGLNAPIENRGITIKISDLTKKCRECSKEFSTVHSRLRHEKSVHYSIKFNNEKKSFENATIDNIVSLKDTTESNEVTIEQFAASLQLVLNNVPVHKPKTEKHFIEFNNVILNMMNELKCYICKTDFQTAKNLHSHIIKIFPVDKFSCFTCCIAFPNSHQYKKHQSMNFCEERSVLIQDKNIKAYQHYQCTICGELYVHDKLVSSHLTEHLLPGPTHPRSCERCKKPLENMDEYKEHFQSCCFYKIYCSMCKESFTNEEFEQHCNKHDDDGSEFCLEDYLITENDCRSVPAKDSEVLNNYSCSTCGDQFSTLDLWCEHQKLHDDSINRCTECNRVFGTELELEEHKSSHNNNIKLKLFRCSSTNSYKAVSDFSSSNSNSPHLEETTEGTEKGNINGQTNETDVTEASNENKCFCGKEFASPSSLEKHRKTHAVTKRVDQSYIKYKRYSCPKCKGYFRRLGTYRAHRKNCIRTSNREIVVLNVKKEYDDSQGNGFECNICHRSFETERGLTCHSKYHTQGIPSTYSCDICHKSFDTERKLTVHSKLHSPDNYEDEDNVCYICNKSFETDRGLQNHNRMHGHCQICNKYFDTDRGLSSHNAKVHPSAEADKMNCQFCKKTFLNVQNLIDHLKTHTGKSNNVLLSPKLKSEKSFKCENCEKEFLTHKGKAIHQKTYCIHRTSPEIKVKTEPGLESFHCNFCNTAFQNRTALNSHIKVHLNGMNISYNCTFCSRIYTNSYQLTVHVQSKHSNDSKMTKIKQEFASHRCNVCKKSFVSQGLLQQHLKVHAKLPASKKYKCPNCFQNLPSASALSRHLKANCIHCIPCDKYFTTPKGLSSHKGSHKKPNKDGTYSCLKCDGIFETESILNNHLKTHKKMLKCKYCQKNFHYKKSLAEHCAIAHDVHLKPKVDNKSVTIKQENTTVVKQENPPPKNMYRCTECNTTFVNSKRLRLHVLSAHVVNDVKDELKF